MEEKNKIFKDLAETPYWAVIRQAMEEELARVCDISKLNNEADLRGAQITKDVIKNIIRKVEGAKDAIDMND